MMKKLRQWVKQQLILIKTHIITLSIALKHKSTPFVAKVFGLLVMVYALSPIDLIPDFIPIIGYVDDLLILPIGLWVFRVMITKKRWEAYQALANKQEINLRKHWYYAMPIIMVWVIVLIWLINIIFY